MQNRRYKNPLELIEGRHMHPLLRVFKFVAAVLLLIPVVAEAETFSFSWTSTTIAGGAAAGFGVVSFTTADHVTGTLTLQGNTFFFTGSLPGDSRNPLTGVGTIEPRPFGPVAGPDSIGNISEFTYPIPSPLGSPLSFFEGGTACGCYDNFLKLFGVGPGTAFNVPDGPRGFGTLKTVGDVVVIDYRLWAPDTAGIYPTVSIFHGVGRRADPDQ
jgi:hypothetical protein